MQSPSTNLSIDILEKQVPAWTLDRDRNAIHRRLVFATFGEALAAMVRIGVAADKAGHHPEWTNVYGTIDIWLTTHDTGGFSERDLALARVIDDMYSPQCKAC